MLLLFFDTETTGLPKWRQDPILHPEHWPRIVQIAWMLCDEQGEVLDEQSHIIYPDGFDIPPESSRIHGITTDFAKEKGVSLDATLDRFISVLKKSDYIVGHNIDFDRKVLSAEFSRSGTIASFTPPPYVCTMKATAKFCNLPHPSGKKGCKWPKLEELHQKLFDCSFENAHDALSDVKACMRCYFECKKRGVFDTEMNMARSGRKKRLPSR